MELYNQELTSLGTGYRDNFEANMANAYSTSKYFNPDLLQDDLFDGLGELVDFEYSVSNNQNTEEDF